MSVDILGVRVDRVTMKDAVGLVEQWVKEGGKYYIVTPNPEFVIAAQKDPEFKRVLNDADLAVPDGIGLKLAGDIKSIIAGVDLVEKLCQAAADHGFTTGFLGGRDGSAEKAAECLKKKYPTLKVVFAEDGPEVGMDGRERTGVRPASIIPPCSVLFVAFGQVKQEKWIARNLPHLPVKVMMGVGGSLDEISGRVPRIPGWVQRLGFKWLARLILQPWRIKRQLALFKFVWLAIGKSVLK